MEEVLATPTALDDRCTPSRWGDESPERNEDQWRPEGGERSVHHKTAKN